jgi:hypothetical protein
MGTKAGHNKPGDIHVIPFLKSQYIASISIKSAIPLNEGIVFLYLPAFIVTLTMNLVSW